MHVVKSFSAELFRNHGASGRSRRPISSSSPAARCRWMRGVTPNRKSRLGPKRVRHPARCSRQLLMKSSRATSCSCAPASASCRRRAKRAGTCSYRATPSSPAWRACSVRPSPRSAARRARLRRGRERSRRSDSGAAAQAAARTWRRRCIGWMLTGRGDHRRSAPPRRCHFAIDIGRWSCRRPTSACSGS